MLHSEFIDKMARYKPVFDAVNGSGERHDGWNWAEVGKTYGMSGSQAWAAVDYYERHKSDPQLPAFGKFSHYTVTHLYPVVRLESIQTIREDLCAKFKAKNTNEGLNHKHTAPKQDLIKVMKASGLKWFLLNDIPYIHWSETP